MLSRAEAKQLRLPSSPYTNGPSKYPVNPGFHNPRFDTSVSTDPVPVLEQAVAVQQRLQKSQDHELQNSKLRQTLEEYKMEFAQVKSQGQLATHPPLTSLSVSLSLIS